MTAIGEFLIILAADLVASTLVEVGSHVKFARKKRKYKPRRKKLAVVVPLRKTD